MTLPTAYTVRITLKDGTQHEYENAVVSNDGYNSGEVVSVYIYSYRWRGKGDNDFYYVEEECIGSFEMDNVLSLTLANAAPAVPLPETEERKALRLKWEKEIRVMPTFSGMTLQSGSLATFYIITGGTNNE